MGDEDVLKALNELYDFPDEWDKDESQIIENTPKKTDIYDRMPWALPEGKEKRIMDIYDENDEAMFPLNRTKGGKRVKAIDHDKGRIFFYNDNTEYYLGNAMPRESLERLDKMKPGEFVDPGTLFNVVYDFKPFDADTVDWSPYDNRYQWKEREILDALKKEK